MRRRAPGTVSHRRRTIKRGRGKCNFPIPPMYRLRKKKQSNKKFHGDQKYLACMKKKPPKKTRMATNGDSGKSARKAHKAKEVADKAHVKQRYKCRQDYKRRKAAEERYTKKRL